MFNRKNQQPKTTETSSTSHRKNRIRGLQSSINNPRTTEAGREGAQIQLEEMGVRPNKEFLGTKLRHLFGMKGKTTRDHHRRRQDKPVHAY